jgi:hypothetical protein
MPVFQKPAEQRAYKSPRRKYEMSPQGNHSTQPLHQHISSPAANVPGMRYNQRKLFRSMHTYHSKGLYDHYTMIRIAPVCISPIRGRHLTWEHTCLMRNSAHQCGSCKMATLRWQQ